MAGQDSLRVASVGRSSRPRGWCDSTARGRVGLLGSSSLLVQLVARAAPAATAGGDGRVLRRELVLTLAVRLERVRRGRAAPSKDVDAVRGGFKVCRVEAPPMPAQRAPRACQVGVVTEVVQYGSIGDLADGLLITETVHGADTD